MPPLVKKIEAGLKVACLCTLLVPVLAPAALSIWILERKYPLNPAAS
jgi:hypothetical protein